MFLTAYPRQRFGGVVQGIGWAVRGVEGGVDGVVPAVRPTLDWSTRQAYSLWKERVA